MVSLAEADWHEDCYLAFSTRLADAPIIRKDIGGEGNSISSVTVEGLMETTSHELHCLHCDAVLPTNDIAEGWCNACGKRLPSSIQASRSYAASLPPGDPETEGLDLHRLVCGGTIVILSGLVAGVFLFNVF